MSKENESWKCVLDIARVNHLLFLILKCFFLLFFFFDALYQEYLLKAAQRIKEEEEEFTDKPSRHVWQFRENPAADWLKKGE